MFHVEQIKDLIEQEKKTSHEKNSSKEENLVYTCKDHLVTKKSFEIISWSNGILKTNPVPEDLEKYYQSEDYISHQDSSKGFQDKIYHTIRSYMLSKKASWIRNEIKQGTILDFGAGTGEFLNKMKSFSWTVEGVEPNLKARSLGILKNLDLKTDLSRLENKKFDVITLWHVLEHLPDYVNKIHELRSILEPDGIIIIALPNYNSYDAQHYKELWAAWDVPRHIWHFSREGIKNKMKEMGFSFMKEKPLIFDSYYVSLLSEKNSAASGSNFIKAFFQGALSNRRAKRNGEYSSLAYFFRKK